MTLLLSAADIIAANPVLFKAQQKMQQAQQQQRAVEESLRPVRRSNSSARNSSARKSVNLGPEGRRSSASTPTRAPRLSGASTDSAPYVNPNMKQLGTAELHDAVLACLDLLGQRVERVEWAIAHPPAAPTSAVSKGPSRWHNINKTLKRSSQSAMGSYSPLESERDADETESLAGARAKKQDSGGNLGNKNNMCVLPCPLTAAIAARRAGRTDRWPLHHSCDYLL